MGMNCKNFATCLLIITVGYLFYKYVYDGTEYMKSTVDNQYYKVQNVTDKQLRADILAILNGKLKIIVNKLSNDTRYNNKQEVKQLINNWNSGVTIKEVGKLENDAAYVINKKNMSFCLQKSQNLTLPELNLITYVGIHELAHIMSNELGHGKEFIKNFEFLLEYAKNIEYYDPVLKQVIPLFISLNKLPTSNSYCGVSLENSIS